MTTSRSTALSKAVSHALRHDPQHYGLELDVDGWVRVDDLVAGLRQTSRRWQHLRAAELTAMVSASVKQRFELRGERIRARYGHSLPVRAAGDPAAPPAVLFHGTTAAAARAILVEGLLPMGREYVHLSADEATAVEVGRRRTRTPVVLRVAAEEAASSGQQFWRGTAAVWLAERIEARFLTRMEDASNSDET
jgi:putative RNA 2'-phosphotransferase